jgi:Carboxypeptidase regulatory-like domain
MKMCDPKKLEAHSGSAPTKVRGASAVYQGMLERGEKAFRRVVLLSLIALLQARPIDAQTFYGTILGTVTDASGGAMIGARVSLTNWGTAERLTAQTDVNGDYQFLNLLPGMYKLDVEQPRFKHLTRDQIQVRVDNATRVDVSLELGELTQSVQVASNAVLLQTESAALNQVVEGRQVQDMPLNGRNVLNLIALAPGVVPLGSSQGPAAGNAGANISPGGFGNYSIGGGLAAQNAIFIDGVQDNLSGNNTPLVPTQDSIQEFSVATNNVDTEFGQFGGGIVNMITKSGTNSIHGTLYEYFRNKILNANDFFSNRNGVPRAPFTQNQYGATLGGPIIPNKTFFFSSWERFKLRTGIPSTFTVPTASFRAGNFAGQRLAGMKRTQKSSSSDPVATATLAKIDLRHPVGFFPCHVVNAPFS